MKVGKTVYFSKRARWRAWLRKHNRSQREIWLIYYRKESGKPRIPYTDAVEEALCFGWIDSIQKKINRDRFAQRFTPRKSGSAWSEMNKERVRRLIKQRKMTSQGMAALGNLPISANRGSRTERLAIPSDILRSLKNDRIVWKNFQKFPASYKRIRIGWIAAARRRPEIFSQRLRYFLKMTARNKKFGMVQ